MSLTNLDTLTVEPDKHTYSESVFYKTKLFISVNNVTNSEALRQDYLYRVKYGVTIHSTDKHKGYVNIFMRGKTKTVLQPLWAQFVKITTTTTDSDTIYVEDTRWSDFRVGSEVFLYQQFDEANIATISEVGQNYIKLTESTTVYEGMYAIPSFRGYIKQIVNTKYSNELFIKGDILIEELQ